MQKGTARGRPRAESEPRVARQAEAGEAGEAAGGPKKKKVVSRDSSVGSGREVRCGCQYFQTDSLLPERVTLVGRPPSRNSLSRTSNMAATMGDHEYEPINPRPQPVDTPPATKHAAAVGKEVSKDVDKEVSKDVDEIVHKKPMSETSSVGSGDRDFIIISLHDDADVKHTKHHSDDEEAGAGEEGEKQLSPQELQTRMEERYFAATPTTTESRTDCDVNTSQLDSSGLEDLPLRRGSRKKKPEEGDVPARGFQQRIRSQAGRIRAKLRSMKMPERPKFNLPDRPKFTMPERPKFNLPDRPKFSMPERPKFNFPDRPKFNIPSIPSFSRNKASTSSTRRPLRDRATNPSSESNASSSRKNLFDFDFKTYPRIFDRSKRKSEYTTSSPRSTPRSQTPPPEMESTKKPRMPSRKKGPVGSRWVHRFSDIKYVDDEENKQEGSDLRYRRGDSPDVRVIRLRDSTDDEREERLEREALEERERLEEMEDIIRRREMGYGNEVRDAVEELERKNQERDSGNTESMTAFHDKDYGYAVTNTVENMVQNAEMKEESFPDSDKEQRSSGSSSDRHRAGVLEEIDSDEFFLREKGISREDVEVERYLTSEIRDAFRSPTSALSKMDDKYYYDDDEDNNMNNKYQGPDEIEPVPPIRTRSLKPRKRTNKAPITPEEDTTNFFNTFPPARPKRNRHYQQECNDDISKDEEIIEEEVEPQTAPSFLITEHNEMSYDENENEYRNDDRWQDEVVAPPPTAPTRVRRSRVERAPDSSFRDQVPEQLRNGHRANDDSADEMDSLAQQQQVFTVEMEHEYIIPGQPESPPVAPRRDRRKTSRGASLHSLALADEDRTSRGAESLPSEHGDTAHEEEDKQTAQQDDSRIGTFVKLCDADMAESGGYATVEKIYPTKPARPNRPKPPRPPAPTRRKRLNHFFSLPRKNTHAPPTRPLRNYSTLGPSRPNRREKTQKRENQSEVDDDYSRSVNDDMHGSNRDLNSGEVIEKMKGRPLPAPPRPPRKSKDAQDGTEPEVEEEIFDMIEEPFVGSALGALNDSVFYSQKETGLPVTFTSSSTNEEQETMKETTEMSSGEDREAFLGPTDIPMESEFYEEVSVATQTDPLPEDFCMDMVEDEPPAHADASTETNEQETIIPQTTEGKNDKAEMADDLNTSATVNAAVIEEIPCEIQAASATQQEPPVTEVNEPIIVPIVESIPTPIVQPSSEPIVQPIISSNVEPIAAQTSEPAPSAVQPPLPPTIIERQVPVYILPDQDTVIELKAERLQVSDLDVSRLNVGELSAQRIRVSDIDSANLQVAELSSKSGNLVINGIELPPGFLQELYDLLPRPSIPSPQPESAPPQTETPLAPPSVAQPQESVPPSVPPLPMHIPMESMYSFIPSAMRAPHSRTQDMESEEEMMSFMPTSSSRRRRHHVQKPVSRYSSDEEEEVVSFQPRRQMARSEASTSEHTVGELSRQLVSAVHSSTVNAMRSMLQYTASQFEGEEKKRELQTAICILLVIVAGLILMGFGTGKPQHHHHWDYFNPPNN